MKSRGFTLIEVMIAVAVIGILAAIAYPSYVEYTKKARRAEAAAVLMDAVQVVERGFSQTGAYSGAGIPGQSPVIGDAVYTINFAAGVAGAGGYVVTANAVAGGMMAGDTCAAMSINAVGVQAPNNDLCWRR